MSHSNAPRSHPICPTCQSDLSGRTKELKRTAAQLNAGEQAFRMISDVMHLGRVVYMTIKDGHVPKGEAVLTIHGKQYRLSLSHKPNAVTIMPIGKEG